jgi:hypothetical protein
MVSNTDLELTMSADAEFAELASTVRGEGMGVTPVKALNNNADQMVDVYHAITNHSHRVPYYMVDTTEGHSLLRVVFTEDDIRQNQIDPKWTGKRVWHLQPQSVETPLVGDIYCTFSVHQSDEEKAKISEQGFIVDCRKNTKFRTRYDMENHRRLRHPRRDTAMKQYASEKNAEEIARANAMNAQALAQLMQMMQAQAGAATPAPAKGKANSELSI